jgi:hypothetical protein
MDRSQDEKRPAHASITEVLPEDCPCAAATPAPKTTLKRSQTHTDAVGAAKRQRQVGKRKGIAVGSHIAPAHLVSDHHDARELHLRAQDLLHAVQHPNDVAGVVLRRLRRQRLPPGAAQAALMRRPAAGGAQRRAG